MTKYNIEDLLRIVEENKDIKKPRSKNEVLQFINETGLKEGKNKINGKLLYKAYQMWGGKKSNMSFKIQFGKYFERKLSGRTFYYYDLNLKAVELLNKLDNQLIKI